MSAAANLVTISPCLSSSVKEALEIIAQFLENRPLIDLAATNKGIGKAVKFEVGLRREVWVDSRPHSHGRGA
jgi:hypothetical protein